MDWSSEPGGDHGGRQCLVSFHRFAKIIWLAVYKQRAAAIPPGHYSSNRVAQSLFGDHLCGQCHVFASTSSRLLAACSLMLPRLTLKLRPFAASATVPGRTEARGKGARFPAPEIRYRSGRGMRLPMM